MLGHVVSLMKNIVVAGSHGKTTTASLISNIFSSAKIDPTVINGGVLIHLEILQNLEKAIGASNRI